MKKYAIYKYVKPTWQTDDKVPKEWILSFQGCRIYLNQLTNDHFVLSCCGTIVIENSIELCSTHVNEAKKEALLRVRKIVRLLMSELEDI